MQTAISESSNQKISLVTYIVRHNLAASDEVAWYVSNEFSEPLFDIDQINRDTLPKDIIDERLVHQYNALPIFVRGQRLFVAMSDPTCLDAIDAIQFHSDLKVQVVIVDEKKLAGLIEFVYAHSREILNNKETLNNVNNRDLLGDTEQLTSDNTNNAPLIQGVKEISVVQFVHKMLVDAISMGASDLHFEPYEKFYRVRFRIDGVMHEMSTPPIEMAAKISARLKIMSQMDISERRIPQDGRIKLEVSKNRSIDFRVNSLPTLFGEKIALRILDPTSALVGIDALGYDHEQKALFLEALHRPQGMILITGPTGSGKTVSLYTGLEILNTAESNISSVEDPVEINLAGINQVNVNTKVGLTFAVALKSFLRQDPDIVMVGEIRDLETADTAIKAAQTGHLVLSTLHTNSAPETLTRLHHMGVPYFNIATSISLVVAQRLARRLCHHCKIPTKAAKLSLLEMGFTALELENPHYVIYDPVGCSDCRNGYKGRIGIFEVMKMNDSIAQIIMQGGNAIDIKDAAIVNGFRDLRRAGIVKVLEGIIGVEEMSRVTSE